MSVASVTDYILPIGLLLLYFFVTSRKKKPKPTPVSREHHTAPPPVRRREPPPLPRREVRSPLETQMVGSPVTARQFQVTIETDVSQQILSEEMQKYSRNAEALAPLPKKRPSSRAAHLFRQKQSLRQAILIKEILTRPFE